MSLHLKVPPLAVFLVAGAAMPLIDRLTPSLNVTLPGRAWATGVLVAISLIIAADAIIRFAKARTTIHPMHPEEASRLVTTGLFSVSRNPMYLGLLLLLLAWAIWLSHLLTLLVLPAFVAYMNRYQIAPEEAALRERFGPAYLDYTRHVRRWL